MKCEGVARELIKRIQNHRKTAGFEVTDRIKISLESNAETDKAVAEYADYISSQVLATEIKVVPAGSIANPVELDMDDYMVKASIQK